MTFFSILKDCCFIFIHFFIDLFTALNSIHRLLNSLSPTFNKYVSSPQNFKHFDLFVKLSISLEEKWGLNPLRSKHPKSECDLVNPHCNLKNNNFWNFIYTKKMKLEKFLFYSTWKIWKIWKIERVIEIQSSMC